jgi:kumamolisin
MIKFRMAPHISTSPLEASTSWRLAEPLCRRCLATKSCGSTAMVCAATAEVAPAGGVSAFNDRPSWQSNIDIVSVNANSLNGRIAPDVAANAAGSTGYLVVAPDPKHPAQSIPMIVGGTSASTPLWASLIALLLQAGKNVGFLPPKLYDQSPNSGGKLVGEVAFRDIVSGNNASGTADGYSAGPGFDAVTGWGSPNGSALLETLP